MCRKINGRIQGQKMADLPAVRITEGGPPFLYTGLDFFGPFLVRRGRGQSRIKRYGVIFTCLTMRAVHLEVAADMTTDSFINVLRRFIGRRGQVKTIMSDHGTNMIGVRKEIRNCFQEVNSSKVERELMKLGVDWKFNPPGASHFGGVWERMIGVFRRVFECIRSSQILDDDSLATLFCEVEAIINSRPLCPLTSDVNDSRAITPNMLLTMGSCPEALDGIEAENCLRKRWRQVQHLAEQFWIRWRKEYLTTLQTRQKWRREKRNVQVGDIVLMVCENSPRCHWPLAIVEETMHSNDGFVRRVKLRANGKIYERPIWKLVLLLEYE